MPKATIPLFLVAGLLIAASASLAQSERTGITPDNATDLSHLIRLGRGSVERAAFTPNGETLAVASSVGVWLYDPANLATETEPPLLDTAEGVRAVVIAPDNATLAASFFGGTIEVWDLTTQQRTRTVEISYAGGDHIALSPDGSLLAVNAGSSGIDLLDAVANSETLLAGSFRSDSEVTFSPDGAWLAAAGSDNAVYIWDVANSEEAAVLEGHSRAPASMSFSPDASLLATGSGDSTIRLWNVADWTENTVIDTLDGSNLSSVTRVRFSPDGSLLASGHSNGAVVLWNAADSTVEAQFNIGTTVQDLTFSPDGSQLITVASNDRSLQAWDVASGELIASAVGHTPQLGSLAFSPDSSTLAFNGSDGDLWLWDTASMQELNFGTMLDDQTTGSAENVTGVAWSSDGSLIAAMDSFSIRLLDAATNGLLYEMDVDGITDAVAFSPDDSLLAAISSDGLFVFDVSTGEQLAAFTDHHDWLTSVAFSPDQTLLATSARDNTVRVYGIE